MGAEILGRMVRGGLSGLMLFGSIPEGGGDPVGISDKRNSMCCGTEPREGHIGRMGEEIPASLRGTPGRPWGPQPDAPLHSHSNVQQRYHGLRPTALWMCISCCTTQLPHLFPCACVFSQPLFLPKCLPSCSVCCSSPGLVPFQMTMAFPGQGQGGEPAFCPFTITATWALPLLW